MIYNGYSLRNSLELVKVQALSISDFYILIDRNRDAPFNA